MVRQPGANAADFADEKTTPHLTQWLASTTGKIRSSVSVADVVGEVDASEWISTLEQRCGADVVTVDSSKCFCSSR